MDGENEGQLVSDHRVIPHHVYNKIGLTFVGLCFLVGMVYVGYLYYAGPTIAAEQQKLSSDNLIAQKIANLPDFTFTIVPDALSAITIPDNNTESVDALKAEFASAKTTLVPIDGADIESIYDMPVGEMTYLEYLNGLPRDFQDPLLQMQSEVEVLVSELNKKYEQETLAARIGKIDELLYPEAVTSNGALSVYPSQRATTAYLAAAVLSRQLPSQAEFYREYVAMYVDNAIAYGHYSKLDAAISKMVVDDYMVLAEKNEQVKLLLTSIE